MRCESSYAKCTLVMLWYAQWVLKHLYDIMLMTCKIHISNNQRVMIEDVYNSSHIKCMI